jgi:hypothetical protein
MTKPTAAGPSEAAWQSEVFGLLRFYGWRYFHGADNRPVVTGRGRAGRQHVGDKGFPDVVATRRLAGLGPELVIAELKTDTGRYGPGQEDWLADLGAFAELTMYALNTIARMNAAQVDAGVAPAEDRIEPDELPAIGVYTWRPADRGDVERILAGPAGVNAIPQGGRLRL